MTLQPISVGGTVALPEATFERAGRTITIFGVCHVAPAGFWDGLNEALTQFDSDVAIHLEKVTILKRSLSQFIWRGLWSRWAEVLDWVPQHLGLRPPRRARVVDVTVRSMAQVVRRSGVPFMLLAWLLLSSAWAVARLRESSGQLTEELRVLMRKMLLAPYGASRLFNDDVVLHRRNSLAIEVAQSQGGDVVLVWGAAHLPGMAARLTAQGWNLVKVNFRSFDTGRVVSSERLLT